MKKLKFAGFILIFLLISGNSFSQTVDQIVNNYFKNAGGKQNWQNLQTVTMHLKISADGMEMNGTMYSKRPDKMKQVITLMNKSVITAYDGKDAWMKNPFMPDSSAQLVPDEIARSLKQHDFEPEYLNYAEKGNTLELTGTDTLNNRDVYEIKLTKKDGSVEYHYFDKENFMPVMTKSFVASGQQKGAESDMYFSDFRKVDGLTFPFLMETHAAGNMISKIEITGIEINKALDDSFFAFPKQ